MRIHRAEPVKRRRKQHIAAGAVLTSLGLILSAYIQLDRWRIERHQMKIDMAHRQEVTECEESGGRWWRGDCERLP